MTLKFNEPQVNTPNVQVPSNIQYIQNIGHVPGRPMGLPNPAFGLAPVFNSKALPPPQIPGEGLKRALNYYADYAGCGWWRMIAPELLLNIDQKAIINGLTTMVLEPNFYNGLSAVRLQRQATAVQKRFVEYLKNVSKEHGYKVIYEIDDIIFMEDIPDFNRCKVAFENPEIRESSVDMMRLSDEVSVTCQFMKEYYIDKTGNKNITVIPNYPAKFWMDNHYHPETIALNFEKNKKKPRIAYIGSGTHIDISNRTNQKDDFAHVVNNIIKSRNIFTWVFIGAFPLACKPFIDRGEMEFVQWFPLKDLWKAYVETNCQAVYAPLVDCTFNKAKSNIKFLEASTCGIPGAFQDLVTYKDAPIRFKTGNELIDQLKLITSDINKYMKLSKEARKYANTMWLDDHLDEFHELYFTRIGDPNRKALLRLNPEQKSNVTYENKLLNK